MTPRFLLMLSCAIWAAGAQAQGTLTLDPAQAVDTQAEAAAQETPPEAAQAAAAATRTDTGTARAARQVRRAPRQQVRRQAPVPGFVVRDIRYRGSSSYVTAKALADAEAPYRGRRLTSVAQVQQLGQRLTDTLYRAQGITTAQAVVRDVNVRSGVITVELLEARVGAVKFSSNVISDDYMAWRLGLTRGALADNRKIEARLLEMQLTEGLAPQLSYEAGAGYGETDLVFALPELKRHSTVVTLDNYGAASTGKAQLSVSHVINSLTGWNDPLAFSLGQREGGTSASVSYGRVVTPRGARLSFSLSGSDTKTLAASPVHETEYSGTLGLNFPIITTPERQLSANVRLGGYRKKTDFLGTRTLDQRGRDITLALNGLQRGDSWTLSGGLGVTAGQYDDSVASLSGVKYSYASLNLSYAHQLGKDVFGSVTLAAQKRLGGTLPSTRQFTVTGPSAVRGYPTSLSSGAEGYYARLQVEKSTPYVISNAGWGVRPFAFFDIGEAYDATGAGLGQAQSVGLGMSFANGKNVFGDVFIAKPLKTNITGWANPSKDVMIGGSIGIRF